nr:MAG: hypothetical protein DIU62_15065 [Pseudomonadota bacterium]
MLAGCASTAGPPGPSPQEQIYVSHAGEPVQSFRLSGPVNGWSPVSDDKLVVRTGVHEAWLLSVDPACVNLESAFGIGLTTSMGGSWVQSGFDFVRFDDGAHGQRCRITDIRPLDEKAAREELKAAGLRG